MRRSAKLNVVVCTVIFAAAVSASAKQGETCRATFGGQAVCGDLVIGLEADLKKQVDKIWPEEAERRNQRENLMELTERRATSAEENSLWGQIAGDEKRALAESNDGLGQKLAQMMPTRPPFQNPLPKVLLPELPKVLLPELPKESPVEKAPAEKAKVEKAAEKAKVEKAAEKAVPPADDRRLLLLGFGAAALLVVLGGVSLWLIKRRGTVRQTTVATPTAVTAATTGGKAGPIVSDIVNCSVFAPPRVAPGVKFMVQAHLHVSKDFVKVAREAARTDASANRLGYKQLPLPVPRGAYVELFLEFDEDLIIRQPFRQLEWQGASAKEVFEVEVPANLASESIKGILTVGVDSVPVGDIEFKLHVTTNADVSTKEAAETYGLKYENAFVSYSRKDFRDVSLVAQALATRQVNLLVDVTELEPGDDWAKELPGLIGQADVFYLIWSENASKSKWVDKEARHARRLYDTSDPPSRPRIRPITLKRPAPKPPDYLMMFHFDSPWLAQRTAHEVPLFLESS